MRHDAARAYEQAAKASGSIREVEAAALFKAARMLETVRGQWDAPDRDARLGEALRYNQRLWTFFQNELSQDGHPLPEDIRTNLLRLSQFVDKRTFELLAKPDRAGLATLIEINRNIAAGLSGRAAA